MEALLVKGTIDIANATQWDDDWYILNVSATDMSNFTQLSYRIDASTSFPDEDLPTRQGRRG